jgi:tryptophan-rich sensory protein
MHSEPAFDRARRGPLLDLAALVIFGGATVLVAALGSWITAGSVESQWFAALAKPAFYPPDATFGIVWTILYVLIAVSVWIAWRGGGRAEVLTPWFIQLALNLGWTLAFFGARAPGLGMVVIIALLGAAICTALAMWPHSRAAAVMFAPYILWVAFAAALNWSIVALN